MKIITSVGLWNEKNQKFDINLSEFWDELLNNIHIVDKHKTDVVHAINWIEKEVGGLNINELNNGMDTRIFWLGYRASGVDGYDYILDNVYDNHTNSINDEAYWYYRKLFRVYFKIEGNEIHAELAEKDVHDFYREVRRGGF